MDPVEIQTTITLSRVAAGAIPFGVAVARVGIESVDIYGKGTHVLEDGTGVWTPSANVTATNPATGLDGETAVFLEIATGFTTGIVAYRTTPTANLVLSLDTFWGLLIKASINVAAGVLTINVDEGAALATAPQPSNIPALVAGEWTYVQVAITGATTTRDTANSFGIVAVSDPAIVDLTIQRVTTNLAAYYNIAGIVKNDEARDDNISKQYDELTIIGAGHANPVVDDAFTCVAEQPVYFVPGTGVVSTTKIATAGITGIRSANATQDQTTAGKQTGVRF